MYICLEFSERAHGTSGKEKKRRKDNPQCMCCKLMFEHNSMIKIVDAHLEMWRSLV